MRRIPQGLCGCGGGDGQTPLNLLQPQQILAPLVLKEGGSLAYNRGTVAPGSQGQGRVLTKARGGDGVDINLVIADLLVALSVGCWLGQSGALTAMASSHLVHALHHTGLEPLPAGGRALPERGIAWAKGSMRYPSHRATPGHVIPKGLQWLQVKDAHCLLEACYVSLKHTPNPWPPDAGTGPEALASQWFILTADLMRFRITMETTLWASLFGNND